MWAGAASWLLLVRCGQKCTAATPDEPGLANDDYGGSEKSGTTGTGVHESYVLNSLYRSCTEHDCPEVRCALLDERLPSIPVDTKARYVAYTVLGKASQPELFDHLLAKFGYEGCLLLRKLFTSPSIKGLAGGPKAADCAEPHQEFRRVVNYSHGGLQEIYHCLQKRVEEESKKSLLQLAESGSRQDLAFYVIKAKYSSESVTPSSAFIEIVGSWSGDAGRRDRMLPAVIEFIQIILQRDFWSRGEQTCLRESVVRHVYEYCATEPERFKLFHGFALLQSLSTAIHKHVGKELGSDPSLSFVHQYLAYMREYSSNYCAAVDNFFLFLLPSVADFQTSQIRWKSDPHLFNLISPKWLRKMFRYLCVCHPKMCDVAKLMRDYMNMLAYDVCVRVLLSLKRVKCEELAFFMLKHQNARAKKDYRRCLDRDLQTTGLSNQHKGVLRVLTKIFKRSSGRRANQVAPERRKRGRPTTKRGGFSPVQGAAAGTRASVKRRAAQDSQSERRSPDTPSGRRSRRK